MLAEDLSSIEDLERKGWTVSGNPTITENARGKAMDFDGTGDYVYSLEDLGSFSVGTVIINVKFDAIDNATWQGIVNDTPAGSGEFVLFTFGDSKIAYGNSAVKGDTTIENDIWYQVAISWTGSVVYGYLNGTQDAIVSNVFTWDNVINPTVGMYNSTSELFGQTQNLLIFNRVLSATEIAQIYEDTTFDYWMDEVSHWDMSEVNPQDVGWKGNGNDGTGTGLVASTDIVYEDGEWGTEFDGSSESVSLGTIGLTDTDQSIVVKAKTPSDSEYGYFFSSRNSSVGGLSLFLTNSKMRVIIGNTENAESSTDIDDDQWHHLVVSYDSGNSINYYLDGASDGEDTSVTGTWNSTIPTVVGNRPAGTSWYEGTIADLTLYSIPLTHLQVESIYIDSQK